MAKRGRTLTNSLVKTGLINEKRQISPIGNAWLTKRLKPKDALENILDLSDDNLVFLRQWSKDRLYNVAGNHFFIPFLFMLNLLSRYERIPKKDLLIFVHSISPNLDDIQLNELIDGYSDVDSGKMNFDEFCEKNFDNEKTDGLSAKVTSLLNSSDIIQDEFNDYFINGKSTKDSGPVYLSFVNTLVRFRKNPTYLDMKELIRQGKNNKIKKAFGFGKHPFNSSSKHDYTVDEFVEDNNDNALLNGSLQEIYTVFQRSKRYDLVSEYGDMTARLTNLAGVISYENNIASLPLKPVFEQLFASYKIKMSGDDSYSNYDANFNSELYKDTTFLETLNLTSEQIDLMLKSVAKKMQLSDPTQILGAVERQNDKRFTQLIKTKFPKKVVISLLEQFVNRDDDKISSIVTDNAPIADIFEYVLGLAWYYINGKGINVRRAYKMSLDADFLPLSHAAGYQGDLQFEYNNRTLLLEATLMDRSTQKRGELEPVIRHSVNLAIENGIRPTQTIFVASELDDNVLNIFRAATFIDLNNSAGQGLVHGVNIFAMNIAELIQLLKFDVSDSKVIDSINNGLESNPVQIKNNWREPIMNAML